MTESGDLMLRILHRAAAAAAVLALLCTFACKPALAAASETTIHPGDQLSVQVYGDQSLTQNVTVLNDGTIAYPLVGQVSVAGKTPEQAAAILRDGMEQCYELRVPLVASVAAGPNWRDMEELPLHEPRSA